jgi:DNA-binding MarR family transcriptional regulator
MSTDIDLAAWRAILLTQSRVLRAIERDLDSSRSVPLNWYDVLLELNAAPKRQLRMQDLAARAVLSRTRVSRIVTELEAAGYVERLPDPADRRAWLATLTPAGRAALKQTAPHYLDGIARHFNQYVSADDRSRIAEILQPVVEAHQAELDLRR